MMFTDTLQRKKLGMQVNVLIGSLFSYLLVSITLWGFQDMLGSKCDTSTIFCDFIICFVPCV